MWLISLLLAISLAAHAQARAVFAHFMIGNTEQYTNADFVNDITKAQEAHIDGFVLNIAYDDATNDRSIPMAFDAAGSLGFKLLFSFDYAGNGDWPMDEVISLINKYSSHSAHFKRGSQPLVSTFEGFNRAKDWSTIKDKTNCYFMPSWSSVGAKRAVRTGETDGLFSWAAWPEGPNTIDMEVDASYLIFLNGSSYMMPISPWFYTNLPGYNKNWLWRGDSLWHDRWNLAFTLVSQDQWPGQPEYLQIISWNDYGESHYVGPLNDKAYVAFDIGEAPYNYVKGMPHDGWRKLLPYAIDTFKNGIATINQEVLVAWYRLTPASACATGGTTGNTAAQLQPEMPPGELSQDKIFFSALLTSLLTPRVTIDGQRRVVNWDDAPYGYVGMFHGSFAYEGRVGKVLIELVDASGAVVATLNGADLTKTCEKGITNWNPWVGSTTTTRSVSAAPALSLSKQQCMKGTGRDGFAELCEFTCSFGYCPPGPCTCTKLGKALDTPEPKNVDGYPLAGSDCTYKGLCSYACNYGHCPSKYCTTAASAKDKCVIPPEEADPEDSDDACTAGTGTGNFEGLCGFSCGRGYCPQPQCKCTGRGPAITPPPATSAGGYPANGLLGEYTGLCNFACARDYCPSGACSKANPYGALFKEGLRTCDSSDEKSAWNCPNLNCFQASKIEDGVKKRWDSVGAGEFFNYTAEWFYYQNEVAVGGNTMFYGTPFQDQYIRSIAYFYGGRDANGGNRAADNYDCDIIGANACTNPFKCGTTQYPGMDLVFASFSNLHNFITNMYLSIDGISASAAANADSIASTFGDSKLDEGLKFLQEFSEYFGLSMQFAGGSFWSKMITDPDVFKAFGDVVSRVEQLSGTVETFTSLYSTISEAQTEEAMNAMEIAKEVSKASDEFSKQARQTLDKFSKQIFDGSYLSTRRLYPMIADGTWLDAPKVSIFDFHKSIEPIMNAMLINKAWTTGANGNAIVILAKEGHVTYPQPRRGNAALMSNDDGEATQYFYTSETGEEWTLWIAQVDVCTQNRCNRRFKAPKGLDEIREENDYGVTVRNMILSPFFNWRRQGNQNYHPTKLDPYAKNGDKSATSQVPFSVGLDHPGAIPIPVCDIETAWQNIAKWWRNPSEAPCDYYPCCSY
ncbi:hypothetical protein BFJ63_vAg3341 [Fusarium oxysporum f. sp. narcissi]|uniref:Mutanase n=1 Tax=Fusarium oxysporum f. sp. narcissi TaxID=451672 RepID=A0A4Q2W3D9_FUSOX|nr:hypothetical protein BFJ63_vAg3341 [Fusarium oxysporum f. sp. narcissi]